MGSKPCSSTDTSGKCFIAWASNPFDLTQAKGGLSREGMTPNQWVCENVGEFELPTIGVLNNTVVMRSEWDKPLKAGDQWVFISQPAGWETAIYYLVATLIAVAVALILMPSFSTPDVDEQDSMQSLTGQRNRNRAGEPIECSYGRTRIYPSLAARSWNRFASNAVIRAHIGFEKPPIYDSNDQWRYSLYSLGHGTFQIERVMVEDTDVETIPDVIYKFYEPGEVVDMFPDTVTQPEVSDLELFGLTHPQYPAADDGWFGPVVVNRPDTPINRIEVDIIYPRGLFEADKNGNHQSRQSQLQIQYQKIDGDGNASGPWESLTNWSITRNSADPQRITAGKDVPLARYHVRVRRVTPWADNNRINDQANWVAMRGFAESTRVYDVTVLAVAARASNNLNDRAAQRFNVWATRKLPVYRNGAWSSPEPTRNPIWAFCDIWRAKYGAFLADKYLDMPALVDQAQSCETLRQHFDYIFDQKVTVWEAGRQILSSIRGVPVLRGAKISMTLEEPKSAPVMVFNDNNIVKGSFKINANMVKLNEEDGLEIEYFSSETYLPETILCTIDENGDMPKKDRIIGVTDRTRAYREGLYRRAKAKYQRVGVSFDTGASALFLSVGDMVSVSTEFTRWGVGGFVLGAASLGPPDEYELFLSEDVQVEGNSRIFITSQDGTAVEPIDTAITQGGQTNSVYVRGIDLSGFDFTGDSDLPSFVLGGGNSFYKDLIVTRMVPKDRDVVGIEAVFYDERIFAFDSQTAPPLQGDRTLPSGDDAPTISGKPTIAPLVNTNERVLVSWSAPVGATMYLVERSNDGGASWFGRVATSLPYLSLFVTPLELLRVRVSAIGLAPGTWSVSDNVVVGTSFNVPLVDDELNQLVDSSNNILSTFDPALPEAGTIPDINLVIGGIEETTAELNRRIQILEQRLLSTGAIPP